MTEFTVGIAGRLIRIRAMHDYAKEFCQAYLDEGEPDFTVEIFPEDIEFERVKSAREDEVEGRPVFEHKADYLEILAIYRKVVVKMLDYGAFLFHGSSISVDGVGYLFTAKSGTGKSTHTRHWKKRFLSRCIIVNDDKPLLIVKEDGVMVCGTPWDGKHRKSTNVVLPLNNLVVLERGERNEVQRIEAAEALPLLLQQTYRPADPMALMKTLSLLEQAMKKVNLYRLKCTNSPEAVEAAYQGMNRKDELL